jgi:branched-chain amino acid transport system substrate-binding protein
MSLFPRIGRRAFGKGIVVAGSYVTLSQLGVVRAEAKKLKVGVLLPRSGTQALIGQSCQRGADVAAEVIKQLLGVDIEIMSADTESSAEVARSRAERLIEEGAHVLVGAFDSGHTAAIAQVAEQRGIPHIVNIAAAPQITEQGYKHVFRNFPPAPELLKNGLTLLGDMFVATKSEPKSAVFLHVNDTFGQSMATGVTATLANMKLPFTISEKIAYDPAAKDLSVEISKAKAKKPDLVLVVCRLNDAIVLRREMVKQRFSPMGIVSPGSPGLYEEQFTKALGKHAEYAISNAPWFNPKNDVTKLVAAALKKTHPKDELAFHGTNVGYTCDAIMIAADAFKRAGSADRKALTEAIRQTDIASTKRMSLGGAIKFNAKGQVENNRSAVVQNIKGKPTVTLPTDIAEAKVTFPVPDFKKA